MIYLGPSKKRSYTLEESVNKKSDVVLVLKPDDIVGENKSGAEINAAENISAVITDSPGVVIGQRDPADLFGKGNPPLLFQRWFEDIIVGISHEVFKSTFQCNHYVDALFLTRCFNRSLPFSLSR